MDVLHRQSWHWGAVVETIGGFTVTETKLRFTFRAGGYGELRRDGFAAVTTNSSPGGMLLTKPLNFSGAFLFVNVRGTVQVGVEDAHTR